ncbi:HDOD domain-containing protein [Neptunomonas antarctica]|uniref:HDIG domain-containing protein n=1 Tax=Neptunomonas antarctica TaxID=619304 RepID=A0A1N7NMB2_9GAMM|nr:HDOD domain-containing protein [Neptunomonas antarctica]SIS99442.1 HDIG domain-containing protein [Neptunomonas antarctica]
MSEESFEQSRASNLEKLTRHINQLPMLPGVLFQLMKLNSDDNEFYDQVHELAKSDPPLASFILGYANSAASSPNHKINSLQAALTRVGSQTIVELITALSVSKVFIPSQPEHKAIWKHSIETAVIASFLSKNTHHHEVDPEMAYMCGLLHDIGRFVLFQFAPEALNETDIMGWSSPDELPLVEEKILGTSHTEIGFIACQKLNLPPVVASVVKHHHNYNIFRNTQAPKVFRELVLIIQFADFLSVMAIKTPGWAQLSTDDLKTHILAHCIMPNWGQHALPLDMIAKALPMLITKSDKLAASLGV